MKFINRSNREPGVLWMEVPVRIDIKKSRPFAETAL